jgi:hypothetical protein
MGSMGMSEMILSAPSRLSSSGVDVSLLLAGGQLLFFYTRWSSFNPHVGLIILFGGLSMGAAIVSNVAVSEVL